MKLTNEEIVSRYKASTNKMSEVESIVADTGIDPVDLFVLLIECNSIDGRMFRQGVYSEEWHQAKNRVKDENIKQAGHAIVTMSELKKENEELKKKM